MTAPGIIVERYFAALAAGDSDAAMACVHRDAIWRVDGDPVVGTAGIIQGRDAVHAWQVRFPESFRPLDFAVDRLIADNTDVVALGRFRHRVVPTSAIVDSGYAIRFTVNDGLITRYQIFEDSLLIANAFTSDTPARSATINGTAYGWDDCGQGLPVLFLHGLFLYRSFWSQQTSALSQSHCCVAFDMPGHGASGWRLGLDLDGIAEDIALWITEYSSVPVTIVGHSQGGMVAMRLAARHATLFERLVLINGSARAEYPERLNCWHQRRAALLDGNDVRSGVMADMQRLTTPTEWRDANPGEVATEHIVMMRHDPGLLVQALDAAVLERSDIRDLLAAIMVPIAVLSGAVDQATPPALGEEIAAGVAKGTHILVPDAAHHLPTESPEIVTHMISA